MANKIDTTAELKAEMKRNGVRLPHGYTIVKRKPTRSSTAKKASASVQSKKVGKTPAKKSSKQTASQKAFAANSKRAAQLVKSGKAKDTKSAWKIIKSSL